MRVRVGRVDLHDPLFDIVFAVHLVFGTRVLVGGGNHDVVNSSGRHSLGWRRMHGAVSRSTGTINREVAVLSISYLDPGLPCVLWETVSPYHELVADG